MKLLILIEHVTKNQDRRFLITGKTMLLDNLKNNEVSCLRVLFNFVYMLADNIEGLIGELCPNNAYAYCVNNNNMRKHCFLQSTQTSNMNNLGN